MKNLIRYAVVAIAMSAIVVTGWAQRGGGAPSSSSSSSTSGTSSSGSRGDSGNSSSSSNSVSYSSSTGSYGGGSYSSSGRYGAYSGGYAGGYAPDLTGTSWNSFNTWLQWQSFMFHLRSMYMLNYGYFDRFSRNVEPLATPELVRLTYRRPLKLSLQMLDAVDELSQMLQSAQSGTPIDKQAVIAKIQEIRDLNKQIQKDQGLDFLDQRRDKEVLKGVQVDKLDLESINKLREMVTDLSTQLKNTYNQTTPAVISVQSLSQPSFKSMCKEIDKMSKSLESSAHRL